MNSKERNALLDKLLIQPYGRLADNYMKIGQKCWLPWNKYWYYGVAFGLHAAIDLIKRLEKSTEDK